MIILSTNELGPREELQHSGGADWGCFVFPLSPLLFTWSKLTLFLTIFFSWPKGELFTLCIAPKLHQIAVFKIQIYINSEYSIFIQPETKSSGSLSPPPFIAIFHHHHQQQQQQEWTIGWANGGRPVTCWAQSLAPAFSSRQPPFMPTSIPSV
jgi:hypothetical protein